MAERYPVSMGDENENPENPSGFLIAATEEHPIQKLNWLTDSLVWMDQWLLWKDKLKALNALVEEQLAKGIIVPTSSPWSSPVFVIRKLRKDMWHLLHDLRKINDVIKEMGSLQPGMPSPLMLPQKLEFGHDRHQRFFLQNSPTSCQCPRFAFSVPSINWKAPMKCYHWWVLLQGMKNNPTICQWYVAKILSPVHAGVGEAIMLHCMDDVLVCALNDQQLTYVLDLTVNALAAAKFEIHQEKVKRMPPCKYLDLEITTRTRN